MSWEDADFDDFKPAKEDTIVKSQWDDEDKPDLNIEKESWEDEDKPDPEPSAVPKPNPPAKKKKSQLRKDQLKAAEEDQVVPLSAEEKRRRREMEEKADFENSKSLLGLEGEEAEAHGKKGRTDLELSDLSVVVPVKAEPVAVDLSSLSLKSSAGSEKEFDLIAQQVAAKLTGFGDNTHYPYLVKALLKQLMQPMDAEEVREVGKSVDMQYNEKVKQRKGGKVTKKGNCLLCVTRVCLMLIKFAGSHHRKESS
jgi:translation initiation factor 3 subunit J